LPAVARRTVALGTHYRPDIDGLRALAVLSVIGFHVQLPSVLGRFVQGGFVGVDVFFVISGFLITRLITEEVKSGRFSFANFFIRRVRRLAPALFVTLGLSSAVAFAVMTPYHAELAARSLLAAVFSVSNIYFASTAGYFDLQTLLKPFLHTWSLGVEEQFYLVWPASLVFLFRRHAAHLLAIVALIFAVSLGAAEIAVRTVPTQAFYWAPFRAYEFMIGAALVSLPLTRLSAWQREIASAVGLAMILLAMALFSYATPFPGLRALLPALGAGLVIAGEGALLNRLLLANPLAVGIGLVSYSLYLVHWPVIVFYRYLLAGLPGPTDDMAMLGLCGILAVALYRFVEVPLRAPSSMAGRRRIRWLAAAAATAAILVFAGAADIASAGWPGRFPAAALDRIDISVPKSNLYVWHNMNKAPRSFAGDGRPKLLLIGDSQAADFLNVLTESGMRQRFDLAVRIVPVTCQPVFPRAPNAYYADRGAEGAECRRVHEEILKVAPLREANAIILASSWTGYGVDEVGHTLEELHGLSKARVVIVGSKLHNADGPHIALLKSVRGGNIEWISAGFRRAETVELNERLARIAGPGRFIDVYRAICYAPGHCRVLTPDGHLMLHDPTHLTPAGAHFMGDLLNASGAFRVLLPEHGE
jgi:peptidoglycan/LPS O-acetylase OafA/YrhL